MRRLVVPVFIAVSFFLAGCMADSKESTEGQSVQTTEARKEPNVKYQKTREPIQVCEIEDFIYEKEETAWIIHDGVKYGTFTLNNVYKIGIWDWNNPKAVNLGIQHSYSVNCGINADSFIEEYKTAVISADISVVSQDGQPLTEYCRVGWSGFSEVAELFEGTPAQDIELGMQPIALDMDGGTRLKIVLTEKTTGMTFDPIYYSGDVLRKAIEGQRLHVVDDEVVVQSINGAEYSIEFNLVELNERKRSNRKSAVVYDLKYTLRYKKQPSNSRVVSIFDSFDNDNLSPNISFFIEGDNDTIPLYDSVADALEFTDKGNSFNYVTTKKAFSCGEGFIYKTNRKLESNALAASDYVRVVVDFPEERAARDNAEMLDFNARYLVYQLKLTEHVAPRDEDVFGE